jgi:hypothetical protein
VYYGPARTSYREGIGSRSCGLAGYYCTALNGEARRRDDAAGQAAWDYVGEADVSAKVIEESNRDSRRRGRIDDHSGWRGCRNAEVANLEGCSCGVDVTAAGSCNCKRVVSCHY